MKSRSVFRGGGSSNAFLGLNPDIILVKSGQKLQQLYQTTGTSSIITLPKYRMMGLLLFGVLAVNWGWSVS